MIIDQLPLLGGDVQATDEFPIERGTTTYKTTQAALVKTATDAAAAAQLAADNAQDTADEANAKGLPPGGAAGQVLTKTDSSDYSASWEDPSGGGDVTADMLGIVIDGNSTPVGASAGQYVIVKNSTISGATDGLYTAAQEIPANTAIDSTYLTAVSGGGFNSLGGVLSKYGKVLWEGNLSGAGSITVPDLDSYALIGIISGFGSAYMMIGNRARGGMLYGVYRNNTITQLAYRFGYPDNNVLSVSNDDRGVTDGTNTTYSGNASCALIRVIGLIPYN